MDSTHDAAAAAVDHKQDVELVQWICSDVFEKDDEESCAMVMRMLHLNPDKLVGLLCQAVDKGAARCIRQMTPLTGPHFFAFGDAQWAVVRAQVMVAVKRSKDARASAAILEVLNVPWLAWTQHMRGLLHASVDARNHALSRQLIRKGYMEGSDVGGVLVRMWDQLEDFDANPDEERRAVSALFDELLDLLRDCKNETLVCAQEHDRARRSSENGSGDSSVFSECDTENDKDVTDVTADATGPGDLLELRAKTCRLNAGGARKRPLDAPYEEPAASSWLQWMRSLLRSTWWTRPPLPSADPLAATAPWRKRAKTL